MSFTHLIEACIVGENMVTIKAKEIGAILRFERLLAVAELTFIGVFSHLLQVKNAYTRLEL